MENFYIRFDENGKQVAYHDQVYKDISAEIEGEPPSYLAPEGFTPLVDICEFINNEVVVIKDGFEAMDKARRKKEKKEMDNEKFQKEMDEVYNEARIENLERIILGGCHDLLC